MTLSPTNLQINVRKFRVLPLKWVDTVVWTNQHSEIHVISVSLVTLKTTETQTTVFRNTLTKKGCN